MLQAVLELHNRFSFKKGGGRGILLDCPGMARLNGMFNFDAEQGDTSVFDQQLRDLLTNSGAGSNRYKSNALVIYRWLRDQLHRVAAAAAAKGKAGAADDDASAVTQAAWLRRFLDTFRWRVQWTTSLTTSRSLALHTFLNVNLDSHRVPLKEIDVIKVALVSDVTREVRPLIQLASSWSMQD